MVGNKWYVVSIDGGWCKKEPRYATRREAIAAGEKHPFLKPGDKFCTGECEDVVISVGGVMLDLLDHLVDEMFEQVGDEVMGSWPFLDDTDLRDSRYERLEQKLVAATVLWLREEGRMPTFFKVEHMKEHTVPAHAA